MATFKPNPAQDRELNRQILFQCPVAKHDTLKAVARKHRVSLKALLTQMVDFALANMED